MITWHAMGRSGIWELDMEKVLDALVYPEEVVTGHYSRYIAHKRHGEHIIRAVYEYNGEMPVVITVYFPYAERYYKGGGTYADKIFICQAIGGWRAIATYTDGTCIVAEFAADRLSRWDAQGNCIFSINMDIDAIDVSKNGYIYALTSWGTIYGNSTIILDGYGNLIKEAPSGGVDIVVDDNSNSVWVVGADIKRLDKNLSYLFSIDPIDWSAVSVDYTSDGKVWIAERYYYNNPLHNPTYSIQT